LFYFCHEQIILIIGDMKKIIIGLSGIIIVAFVVIMVANAQNNTQEAKKPASEVSADCAKCPSAAACATMADTCASANGKVMECDPAACPMAKK
jgi:hypothetical protein